MYINWTGSLERSLCRSSDQTQKIYARAKETLLEPTTQKLARAKENSIERRTQILWSVIRLTLERRNHCSSEEQTNSLERIKSRSSQECRATGQYWTPSLARATNSSLERRTKILDSNTWFLNPTNLKQTCPTHPIIPNEKIKDNNNNYTMTESTEPESGYNNQMRKYRGRYNFYFYLISK